MADKVFIIHGRDLELRDAIFALLEDFQLDPLDWEEIVAIGHSASPFMLDAVITGIKAAQAVLCILAPEDITGLHPALRDRHEPYHEQSLQMQSRPNVFIELGVALSLRRKRTIIIEFGELRPVADLAGLNVIRFNGENAVEALPKIIARLKRAGCLPAETQLGSWAETFNKLRVYTRRPNLESS